MVYLCHRLVKTARIHLLAAAGATVLMAFKMQSTKVHVRTETMAVMRVKSSVQIWTGSSIFGGDMTWS